MNQREPASATHCGEDLISAMERGCGPRRWSSCSSRTGL
ncbi:MULTISPECIES: hypothetical protein [unclassified Streptomyces]|nr:hypothetical protein [Streptomyces sp. NBC_00523]WUD04271.1 hypothetical protein OHS17_14155 [Streptomyces sp. NBC_00523]